MNSSGLHLLTSPPLEHSSGPIKLLALSSPTEDQPDNITSWPITRLDPYLIPQVGFPTDEPVERALLLLRANQWERGDVIQH